MSQPMKIKAALVRECGQIAVETVNLAPHKPYEVLVKIKATGVCHSDLHNLHCQLRARPPMVLGHEAAGIVESVGSEVTNVEVGDHVVVNWLPNCDQCANCKSGSPTQCQRLPETSFKTLMPDKTRRISTEEGMEVGHLLSCATFAEYAVLDASGIIKIDKSIPFDVAAISGCAVLTGVGAVLNTANVKPGSSAVVVGCGGVGLSVLLGAKLAGCYPLIAVDIVDSKLDFAKELGATHTINSLNEDAIEQVKSLTAIGADYVFDSVGAEATIAQAVQMTAINAATVVTGMHDVTKEITFPIGPVIFQNKQLLGSFAGTSQPRLDIPKILNLFSAGQLAIDKLINKAYKLEEVSEAFSDLEEGKLARGVIYFD